MVYVIWPRPFQHLLRPTCLPNLKSIPTHALRRYERRYKISTTVWFGVVRNHLRSLKIAPFDRAHTISYKRSIVTMSLSCTVFEIERYWSKIADLNLRHLYVAPPFEWSRWNFAEIFHIRELESTAIVRRCLRDPTFSHFSRPTNTGVWRTDGWTDTRRQHIPH